MTIGEKSSEYAEKCFPSDDISNYGKHDVAFHSHTAGAEWMLEKACEYMRSQYPVHYQEWYELAEERVKQFKKAMEE